MVTYRPRMLVLALDTATPYPALALAGERFEGESRLPPGRPASEVLLSTISGLLARAGARLEDVSRIAALDGPGSFTGIRVGLATAWGLARSLGVPLETVGSLEALAETGRNVGAGPVSACLAAERGEFYVATFDLSGPRAHVLEGERIVSAAEAGRLPGPVARPSPEGASAALAAARAVRRAPGPPADVPRARSVRIPAAEELHGVGRS